jgi:hypothetical protein
MSYLSSTRESTLSLIVIPTREGPRIELESIPFPNAISFESNLDTIY